MKYIKLTILNILASLFISSVIEAKDADLICTYRESVRMDVTQPVHTIAKNYENATDIDCCTEDDTDCQERTKNSAREFCEEESKVPDEYVLSSITIKCGKDFAGGQKGATHNLEEE